MSNLTAQQWSAGDLTALLVVRQSPAIDCSNWAALVQIEPRLAQLEKQTEFVPEDDPYVWIKYERMKQSLRELVGWYASRPELRTTQAYDIAHRRLLSKLEARRVD